MHPEHGRALVRPDELGPGRCGAELLVGVELDFVLQTEPPEVLLGDDAEPDPLLLGQPVEVAVIDLIAQVGRVELALQIRGARLTGGGKTGFVSACSGAARLTERRELSTGLSSAPNKNLD